MSACALLAIWRTGICHGGSAGKSAATLRGALPCTTAQPIAAATIVVKILYAQRCCAPLGIMIPADQKKTRQHLLPVLRELESASQPQQARPKSFCMHILEGCKQSRSVAVTRVENSCYAQESANIMSNMLDLCNELWFDIKPDWRRHLLVRELIALEARIVFRLYPPEAHGHTMTKGSECCRSTKGAREADSPNSRANGRTACIHTPTPAILGISLSTRDITQLPRLSRHWGDSGLPHGREWPSD